jgi:hypothetical protein
VDIKIILRLTSILTLSASRTGKEKSNERGLKRRPFLNLYLSIAIFAIVAFIVYSRVKGIDPSVLNFLYSQAVVFLPSSTIFVSMMYSLMFELNQPSNAASVDIINWLPIRPEDYVFASTLSTIYSLSPITSIILGGSTGVALSTGAYGLWALSLFLTVVGSFLGAFTLEIVRAMINRTSRIFRGRGRTVMYFRLILTFIVMASFYVIYDLETVLGFMRVFSGNIKGAWFVPFLWPSLAVTSLLIGDTLWVLGYSILSLALTFAMFIISSYLRSRYWAPAPVSYRLGSRETGTESRGILGWLRFSPAEAALTRKDLRSIVRRREMHSILLMPLMLFVLSIVQGNLSSLFDPTVSKSDQSLQLTTLIITPMLLTLFLSLSSIGQEDDAFDCLRLSPLTARQVIKGKLAASLLPSAPFYVGILFVHVFLIKSSWDIVLMSSVMGIALLLQSSLAGLICGAIYPSFKELKYRTMYMSVKGMLLSYLILGLTGLVTIAPFILSFLGNTPGLDLTRATLISTALSILICFVLHKGAINFVDKILEEEL